MKWEDVFVNELNWLFALEVVVRTLIMFAMILIVLRLSGKKGVRQLSVFEVAIIIAMGSAAGDPMFQKDVAIVPAVIVMVTILIFYRLLTWLAAKNERFESVLEGDPIRVVRDGKFELSEVNKHLIAKDEFFAEMRQVNIEHLGQVREALLETNGNVSFLFFADEQVKPGLPVWPETYKNKADIIPSPGSYACTYCGNVETLQSGAHDCQRCHKNEWVKSLDCVRIC